MIEQSGLAAAEGAGFSLWSLFADSSFLMQIVMLILAAASVWSWAIMIHKALLLKRLRRRVRRFEEKFWSGGALEDLYDEVKGSVDNPMAAVFCAGMKEWRRTGIFVSASDSGTEGMGLSLRIERAMQITLDREITRLDNHMTFLASTGSVSPFLGLFGTVWGIMNSFHAIGLTRDTSLAVVAPGLAEALFSTALGLVAAIPAVVGYNTLSARIDRLARRLETFASEFQGLAVRQLETLSASEAP